MCQNLNLGSRYDESPSLPAERSEYRVTQMIPKLFSLFPSPYISLIPPRWTTNNLLTKIRWLSCGTASQKLFLTRGRYQDKSQWALRESDAAVSALSQTAERLLSDLGSALTRLQRLQGPQSLRTQSSGQGSRLSLAPRGISSGSHR